MAALLKHGSLWEEAHLLVTSPPALLVRFIPDVLMEGVERQQAVAVKPTDAELTQLRSFVSPGLADVWAKVKALRSWLRAKRTQFQRYGM